MQAASRCIPLHFPQISINCRSMGEMVTTDRVRLFRLAAATLIGATPVWMVLLIWDLTAERSGWQIFIRSNSYIVPLIEFIFILIAMAVGFSPLRSISRLPWLTKVAVLLWLPIMLTTSFQSGNDYLGAATGIMKLFFAALFLLALVELRHIFTDSLFAAIWLGVGWGATAYVLLWTVHMAITLPSGGDWVTLVPGVNNVRHIGQFAFAGFFAGVASFISFRNHERFLWRWCVPVFFAALCLGLALWTGSRGPTLAATSGMIVVILFGNGMRKQLCLFFTTSALIATVCVAALPVPHPIYGISGATGVADIEANAGHDASSGRAKLWHDTIEKIQEKPIFGWGLEQFSALGPKDTLGIRHPHNFPLQILFSGGVFSVLLMMLIALPALRRWHWPDKRGIGLSGGGCVAGIIVYSMYDGALFFSYPIMIFMLAIATSIRALEPERVTDM